MPNLRIALDCRISNVQQGVGTAMLALAHALSSSESSDQEYTFIVPEEHRDWLAPHIFGPCRLRCVAASKLSRLKKSLRAIAPLRAVWTKMQTGVLTVPVSDGLVESEGFDLVHFPTQAAYLTRLPSIYQPWDLQHLHYPQFFSKTDYELRERWYRAYCAQAAAVCVQTEWSRQDVIKHYGLSPERVVVVRWGSVFEAYTPPSPDARRRTSESYRLPDQFFFYPAATWPHKNHEVIIRALHVLKSRHGRIVEVFFTGALTEFRATLDALAGELGVREQLHYLGFITQTDLQSVAASSKAMLFPSRFEGFGLPILEAFHARVPVLCSSATVLPEVAEDGAAYFDADAPEQLAGLMIAVLDDPAFRQSLIDKGSSVLARSSIRDMAQRFRELYARTVGIAART
jgi:glycosyltransferase involved in cell wall biosynthesis